MNEANCNVIQDILPLYLDNAVSEDTAKMVEEHLHTCKECMEYKKKMEADIVVTENNEGKKLLRKINGRIRKKIVISVAAAIAALAALIVGGIYVYKWMQVNKMARLSINEISFNYMASPYITDDRGNITAWLFSIARNTYFTLCRKKHISLNEDILCENADESEDVLQKLIDDENVEKIQKILIYSVFFRKPVLIHIKVAHSKTSRYDAVSYVPGGKIPKSLVYLRIAVLPAVIITIIVLNVSVILCCPDKIICPAFLCINDNFV